MANGADATTIHEITQMWTQQYSLEKKIKKTIEKFEDEHDIHLKNIVALKKKVKKLDEACAWTWSTSTLQGTYDCFYMSFTLFIF